MALGSQRERNTQAFVDGTISPSPRSKTKPSDWDPKMTDKKAPRQRELDVGDQPVPFSTRKSLSKMTDSGWESLCDGCGRCCLVKLEDADDPRRTYFTDVGCKLLDGQACRCKDYPNRTKRVNDCVRLTPRNIN